MYDPIHYEPEVSAEYIRYLESHIRHVADIYLTTHVQFDGKVINHLQEWVLFDVQKDHIILSDAMGIKKLPLPYRLIHYIIFFPSHSVPAW